MNCESRLRYTRRQQNNEISLSKKARLYKRIHDDFRNEITFYFDLRSHEHYRQHVYKKEIDETSERQLRIEFHD